MVTQSGFSRAGLGTLLTSASVLAHLFSSYDAARHVTVCNQHPTTRLMNVTADVSPGVSDPREVSGQAPTCAIHLPCAGHNRSKRYLPASCSCCRLGCHVVQCIAPDSASYQAVSW